MNAANDKYKTLKAKDLWCAPSEAEQQILALQTEVKQMNKKLAKAKRGGGEGDPKGSGKKKARNDHPSSWISIRNHRG